MVRSRPLRGSTCARRFSVGQVALTLVLLVGATLFVATLRNLVTLDPGFNRRDVLVLGTDVEHAASTPEGRARKHDEILNLLRTTPGVVSAAAVAIPPIVPQGWAQPTYPENFVAKTRRDTVVFFNRVSPRYFETMRTPLLLGRDFNARDTLSAPRVIIINESAARRFFGSVNAIGRTIGVDRIGIRGERDSYEIVGVVSDTRYNRIDEQPKKIAWLASGQDPSQRRSCRTSSAASGRPTS